MAVLGFRGDGVLLRLSEAGLQQRLDLFLAGPEAVLRRQEAEAGVSNPERLPAGGCAPSSGLLTGSHLMVWASCSVIFWDMLQSPASLLWSPSTAATMLLAATMDGGLAMNFTSAQQQKSPG